MNLTGRQGLGQKAPKPAKKPRKAVRKVSAKRAAYLASDARQNGLAHMALVKGLPCICCNRPPPSAAHHCTGDGMPRDDMRVLPLCYDCHQGQHGYHNAKADWVARNGLDTDYLPEVDRMIAAMGRNSY